MARILCVEDELEIQADLVEELMDAGHEVFAAVNGQEGLEIALSSRPDLIISDCLMPIMTGQEFYQSLKSKHPQFESTPFLFLSAHADQEHVKRGLGLGADAYLTKPVDFDDLLDRVDELLSSVNKEG